MAPASAMPPPAMTFKSTPVRPSAATSLAIRPSLRSMPFILRTSPSMTWNLGMVVLLAGQARRASIIRRGGLHNSIAVARCAPSRRHPRPGLVVLGQQLDRRLQLLLRLVERGDLGLHLGDEARESVVHGVPPPNKPEPSC